MLSQSQARTFFVVGTVFFSGIFLWLTIDTMGQIPKQTNAHNITDAVNRGKHIWEENNCMGCHTLFGEGAYYAPELTKAYERRGEVWLTAFLKDPAAMYPNDRKMVQYDFTDAQIADVIAFLKWAGEVDLNGFPAKPTLAATPATTAGSTANAEALKNAPAKFSLCSACHSVGGQGGNVGPALDGVSARLDAARIFQQIKDPKSIKADSKMAQLGLPDNEIQELVDFLMTLK